MINVPKFESIIEAISKLEWVNVNDHHVVDIAGEVYKVYRNGNMKSVESSNANHSK